MKMDNELVKNKIEEYRKNHTCSQATLLGICEQFDIPKDKLIMLATGFSGGVGMTFEEGTCGAITASLIALGFLAPNKDFIMSLSRELFQDFEDTFDTVQCGALTDDCSDLSRCGVYCTFASDIVCDALNDYEEE